MGIKIRNASKFEETLPPKHRGSRVSRARASPAISQSRLVWERNLIISIYL